MSNLKRWIAMTLTVCMLLSFVLVGTAMPASALTVTNKPANGTTEGQPFEAGTGNSTNFRIPGLVTLNSGRVVATIDARWSWAADAGGIDTLVSVSDDNGANWTYTFANYLGDNGDVANNQSCCFIDPAVATDGTTVYMIADLYPAGFAINSARYYAQPGSTGFDADGNLLLRSDSENNLTFGNNGYETGAKNATYGYYLKDGKIYTTAGTEVSGYTVDAYFNITGNGINTNLFFSDSPYKPFPTDFLYMTKSTDGLTWSEPELLDVKAAPEQSYLVGPGNGTYDKESGRVIFTAYRHTGGASGTAYECTSLIWMDRDGNWKRSEDCTTANWSSEASCVVLDDGTVRVFYRDGYSVLRYTDMIWNESQQNYVRDPEATEVSTTAAKKSGCQLTAIKYSEQIDGKDAIILATPTNSGSRADGHVYVFLLEDDNSMELVYNYDITPGANENYAYSCLSELKNGDLGLLWESAGAAVTYSVLDMDKVTARENNVNLSFVDVALDKGQSVSYTDRTGDYSQADLTELDTDVAEVTVTGHSEVTNSVRTLGTGTAVNTEDCLFTFTASGDNYIISRDLGNDTVVYLNHFATTSSNIPLTTTSNTVAVTVSNVHEGMFKLVSQVMEGGSGGTRGLHFHAEASTPYWDRCGTDSTAKCHEYLYRPANQGEDTSASNIPGFVQITSVGEIVDGGQYLIAAKNDAGNWYVLNPTTSGNHLEYVAQVVGQSTVGSTEITITGTGHGSTEVQIGNTVYRIDVTEVITQNVELVIGETVTLDDERGYYVGADTSALDTKVATVAVTGTATETVEALSDPLKAIVSGKQYIIVNNRANKPLVNAVTTNADGLKLAGKKNNLETVTLWTITQVNGGYTISDANGKYLTISSSNAGLSDTAKVLNLTYGGATWTLGENGQYLNDFGGSGTRAAGYGSVDDGSQWVLHEIVDVVTEGITHVTFTGVKAGETSVRIGDTIYNVTVSGENVVPVELDDEATTLEDTTGAYTTVEGLDESVATVTLTNNPVIVYQANLGENTSFDASAVAIEDCMYTFVKGEDGRWTISATDANGQPIYLYPGNTINSGYPNRGTAYSNMSIFAGSEDGSFSLMSNDCDNGNQNTSYLYFDRATLKWDRVSSPEGNATWLTNTSLYLVRPATAKTRSVTLVPGYEVITDLESLTDGQYLVGAPGNDGNWYVLYPSTSTVSRQSQLGKVGTAEVPATQITITPVGYGITTFRVGGTVYQVSVGGAQPYDKDIQLEIGQTTTVTDETGNYQDDVNTDKLDPSIATVTVVGVTLPGDKSLSNAVTSIESGKTYVLYNTVAQKLMNNKWADASVGGGGTNGLALSSSKENFQDDDCWTITAVSGGYYVQDANGKYLSIAHGKAELKDTSVVLSLAFDGSDWTIGENGQYLNDYGGAHSVAAGWREIDDVNAQWYIYEIVDNPGDEVTEITFEGVSSGVTYVTVGETVYRITVAACEHENTEIRGAEAAGCETPGYTGDTYCTDCGEKTAEGTAIDPAGHGFSAETGVCANCDAQAAAMVTVDGETEYYLDYYSVNSAISNASEDSVVSIKMFQNITDTFNLSVMKGDMTLDLNGCVVDNRIGVYGGVLTVKDSAETKGTVTNVSMGAAIVIYGGKLVIDESVDCAGQAEGHEEWRIRHYDMTAKSYTIGTTGEEDIVIPEGVVALSADAAGNDVEVAVHEKYGEVIRLHIHADENKDHACDNGCSVEQGEHEAAEGSHDCGYCGEAVSDCADADNDHNCDICGTKLTDCADADNDHNCDICGTKLSECSDADNDHNCDICGTKLTECADTDNNHNCDVCGTKLSECSDADNDHNCDVCGTKLTDCADENKDHKCDLCGEVVSECGDTNPADHKCDICGKVLSVCGDENEDGKCDICGAITVPVKPYKITNVVSGVHVYWKAVPGATKYGLWRSETGKDGEYKWIANPTVPHFTDTKVESGKTYYYKVTAMVDGKHSAKSDAISVIYVGTPDITSRFNKAAGITVGWDEIEGATGYAIYRKSYDGDDAWVRVATIEGNETFTWQDTSVKNENGEIYRYTVRALAGDDMKTLSGCRNTGRTMARLTSRVLNSAVKASATSIKCSWTTTKQATGYEVRFMVGSTVYKTFTIGNYATGVKTFTGLQAGQTYKIQVRSYLKVDGMGFYSAWSTAKTVKLP